MLLGLLEPTRGSATVLGADSRVLRSQDRARIGYLAESHRLYDWMKVGQCQRFQSSFYAAWNRELFHAVLDHFGLSETARVRDLSRGQRAGLCLALTLAPEPSLLVLDDPALGLEPVARRSFLESRIYVTRSQGRTVFFSSHLMADVERVADHAAILHEGVLRVACPLETFRSRVKSASSCATKATRPTSRRSRASCTIFAQPIRFT